MSLLMLDNIQYKICLHETVPPMVIQFRIFRRASKTVGGAGRRSNMLSVLDRFWNIASRIRLRIERYTLA